MPNILASIGRSGAVGDFVREARLLRENEQKASLENEKMTLLRNQDERAGLKFGQDTMINEEQIKAARFKQQKEQEAYDEGNKPIPWSSASDAFPSKGMSDAAMEYFQANGMVEEGGTEPGVKQRHLDQFAHSINTKSPTYNPMLANKVSGAHLQASKKKLDYLIEGTESPDAFKAIKEQFPEIKNPEELAQEVEIAKMEYDEAYNTYFQITEKDKIMRQEATAKQAELVRHNKEQELNSRMMAQAANINAGASRIRANKSGQKAEDEDEEAKLNTAEHTKIIAIQDGWADANKSQRIIDAKFLKQRGYEIKETEVDVPNKWTRGTHKETTYDLVEIEPTGKRQQAKGQKDKFGFVVDEQKTKDGKTYTYIGNNQWQY